MSTTSWSNDEGAGAGDVLPSDIPASDGVWVRDRCNKRAVRTGRLALEIKHKTLYIYYYYYTLIYS